MLPPFSEEPFLPGTGPALFEQAIKVRSESLPGRR